MRLIRCRLESIRRHRALEVSFAPGLTLIGGANESGKSSLVEAMHRTLFLRASATGAAIRDLRSATHAGHPQVEIDFDAAGHRWSLLKCFSGAGGTSRLSRAGQKALLGGDAEDQLAVLLGVEEIIGSRQVNRVLPTRWAHLWVMQGLAGRNLLDLSGEHYDLKRLITALEGQAEQSLQSPMDQQVYNHLEQLVASSLTSRGVKQNSELWKRRRDVQQASEQQSEAQERLLSYEAACIELDANEQALDQLECRAPEVQKRRRQLLALKDLQQQLAPLRLQQSQWQQQLSALSRLIKEMQAAETAMKVLRQELKVMNESAETTSITLVDQRRACEQLDFKRQMLEERGHALRRRQDQERLEQRIQEMRRHKEQRAKFEQQKSQLKQKLTALPSRDASDLAALQAQQSQLRELEIRLQSMASRVELQSSNMTVRLDGEQLGIGDVAERTGAFRLEVGEDVTLLVSPGEGTGLSTLMAEKTQCRSLLEQKLKLWGVNSLEAAEALLQTRTELQQQLAVLDARLRQLMEQQQSNLKSDQDLEQLDQQLAELRQHPVDPEIVVEDDLAKALDDCRQSYQSVQQRVRSLREDCERVEREQKGFAKTLKDLQIRLERHEAQHAQQLQQQHEIESRHGSAQTIDFELKKVTHQCELLQDQLLVLSDNCGLASGTKVETSLAELDDRELKLNRQRIDLNRERGSLLERCERLGSRELHAELEEASNRLELAQQSEEQETQLVESRVLLLKRFQDARADLSRRYSSPLRTSINRFIAPFLQHPGDSSELHFDASDGLKDLRLQRSGQSLEFSQLSGGLKEQLNAAVRLAIAEALRDGHDGCLPLLFDDAFTNSDPSRLEAVGSMLRQAVDLGLQVVLLSCDPNPYREVADAVIDLDVH
ncbi:AAA family ATPase [Synechococcus sp. MIT S9508]|uniref:AAA family ATPase n=1 Tax=Synechococcus sp. MIT S9508 TaxID=1801629 RepID=UPI0007BB0ED0|nr:AAA family ATPase [Synechococcus sp. MIT S9508]KZR88348.1 Chromosome partition protein Smc [Synechococcus sp. MIT S9508]